MPHSVYTQYGLSALYIILIYSLEASKNIARLKTDVIT